MARCEVCGHEMPDDNGFGALFHFEPEPMTEADWAAWRIECAENGYDTKQAEAD